MKVEQRPSILDLCLLFWLKEVGLFSSGQPPQSWVQAPAISDSSLNLSSSLLALVEVWELLFIWTQASASIQMGLSEQQWD